MEEKYAVFNEQVSQLNVGQRLDYFLSTKLPHFSRSCIKKWILENKIFINNNIINNPSKKIQNGMRIKLKIKLKTNNDLVPQNINLKIVYEDSDILIIDKCANLVVHPGTGNVDGTILNALLYHYPKSSNLPRAGIVHRLDKNTTGLMVVAKNLFSQLNLIKKIKLHNIIREYDAVVKGDLKKDGIVNAPISRNVKKRISMCVNPLGKHAITKYYIINNFKFYTHLRLRLETGRTHQIRVHMAYINHPLIGDSLYGKRLNFTDKNYKIIKNFNRQALHASFLEFRHPTTENIVKYHSSLPQDMHNLIDDLKSYFSNS